MKIFRGFNFSSLKIQIKFIKPEEHYQENREKQIMNNKEKSLQNLPN